MDELTWFIVQVSIQQVPNQDEEPTSLIKPEAGSPLLENHSESKVDLSMKRESSTLTEQGILLIQYKW